jgi:TPR repeat protein
MKYFILFLSCFFLINHSYAQTSDYNKGLQAFDAKNFKQALVILKPYAEQGNCTAQFAVGFSYMYGDSIKNDSLARHWLDLAADQKQAGAMGPLAVNYFMGRDGSHMVKAYLWAVLAAEYEPAQCFTTTVTLIKMYIKPDELNEANKLIKDYEDKWKGKENCR